MLKIKNKIIASIRLALAELSFNPSSASIILEHPKDVQFGDFSSNIAMLLGKQLGQNPKSLAEALASKLNERKEIKEVCSKIEIAGAGFINFYLNEEYLAKQLEDILNIKTAYGVLKADKVKKIHLEFISANPTGPLTLGNGRGGFFGDVLGNVLRLCGHSVIKEYIINDAGKQIESLGHSVLKDEEAVYKGDYIDKLHAKLEKEISDPYQAGKRAAKMILEEIIKPTVLGKMKIKLDSWFSEYDDLKQPGKIDKIIGWLKSEKLLYEKDGAWWFRSSDYFDDRDRVLVKTNGESTYLAQDFAYLVNKFKEREFDEAILVLGADHHGDVPGLLGAAKVLGFEGQQKIILMQFARLIKDGKEFRMSKRKGLYVTMDEVIEMAGYNATRFFSLMYSPNTHMDFDLDLAKEQSEKNPVYYVQYAYARISGILRQPEITKIKDGGFKGFSYTDNSEVFLLKELLKWQEVLQQSEADLQVHELPRYAISIADKFHQFYNNCRVLDEGNVDLSRLALVKLTAKILHEVLDAMGIEAPEKM